MLRGFVCLYCGHIIALDFSRFVGCIHIYVLQGCLTGIEPTIWLPDANEVSLKKGVNRCVYEHRKWLAENNPRLCIQSTYIVLTFFIILLWALITRV